MRENLINCRKKMGLSQAKTAKALKYSPDRYSKIEVGAKTASIEFWIRAAEFFGETIDYCPILHECRDKEYVAGRKVRGFSHLFYL